MSDVRVLALSGGIGGAKLALGLYRILPPGSLAVLVNTADDFEHLGLHVSPDLDTVMYTLGDLADRERGWGQRGETWAFMESLARFGGETWFSLGDRDLAVHVERSRRLAAGESLTQVTRALCEPLGIRAQVLPMTDSPVRTQVHTPDGTLAFQHYFVREACAPTVTGFEFAGARDASVPAAVFAALSSPTLEAIVICPSNPYISIDPVLAVPGMHAALRGAGVPVVAVSPVIGGEAVKGPTAKMMRELGHKVTTATVAAHYAGLINALVVEPGDTVATLPCFETTTLMRSVEDRERLAREVLRGAAALQAT